jgi:nicotinate-nucleotide adenylyltransferase
VSPLRILYGGTFDPIHNGHLAVAEAAADRYDSEVHLLPAADPPHRDRPALPATERAALVGLAISGHPRLHLDTRELGRRGPSWTVLSLRELRQEQGPQAPLAWLLGADAFADLDRWHDWTALLDLAHWIIAVRPDADGVTRSDPQAIASGWSAALREATAGRWAGSDEALSQAAGGCLRVLSLPPRPEASTAIRRAIAEGAPWEHQVPAPVAARIQALGLYGAAGSGGAGAYNG